MIKKLTHLLSSVRARASDLISRTGDPYTLPPEDVRAAMANPIARMEMIRFSRQEYERNPYYQSVINKLSRNVIGPAPNIIGLAPDDEANNRMEDHYLEWSQDNSIGKSLRMFRRDAALTGLGMLLPYKVKKTDHPISLGYKSYGADALKTPWGTTPEDRIYDGIQYDENWEPIKFHFKNDVLEDRYLRVSDDTIPYDVEDIIYWGCGYENGVMFPIPECVQAFTIYPYIRRFLQAVIEGEEFKQSFPMAVELDPKYYKINPKDREIPPSGKFEYEPKMIPSLKPGMKLAGLPMGASTADRSELLRMMAASAALCVDMPANLAVGDSSDSNMASAQVDIQPWKNRVLIDRFDLHPVFRATFKQWFDRGVLVERFFPPYVRWNLGGRFFPHTYAFDPLFEHPDPQKVANARATDLASGANTLNNLYAQRGKNAKREIQREADLLGVSYEEMAQLILSTRSTVLMNILGQEEEPDESEQRSRSR